MKDFFKLLHDVCKIKRAQRAAKRKIRSLNRRQRWYNFLSKSNWGRIYIMYKLKNRINK